MNPDITAALWIALGGGLGAVARYWIGTVVARLAGDKFPWGTFLVNVLGSFLIGYLGAPLLSDASSYAGFDIRFLIAIGVYGGFTSFAAFSLETLDLVRHGEMVRAMLYVAVSVVLCLGGTALGIYAGQLTQA